MKDLHKRANLLPAIQICTIAAWVLCPGAPLAVTAARAASLSVRLEDSPLLPSENMLRQEVYVRSAENSAKFQKALKAGADKDLRTATRLLREVAASDPRDFETWAELGNLLFRQRKLKEAEKAYMQSLNLGHPSIQVLLNLGQIQLAQKKNGAAIQTLLQAVEASPQNAQAQYYLGEAFLQSKKGSRAILHMNEALRLDPIGMADAHLRLASLYRAANLKVRAAEEYEKFLDKRPAYPERKKLEKYISANKK